MGSSSRGVMLSARRRQNTLQNMAKATINGSLGNMRRAASTNLNMVSLTVVLRSASLAQLKRRGGATWRIAVQQQIVTRIVLQPGSSRLLASAWHEAAHVCIESIEAFPKALVLGP